MDHETGRFRDPLRELVIPPANLPAHLRDVRIIEWEASGEEHVEDEAARPGVRLGPVVSGGGAVAAEDLRRGVRRSSAGGVEEAVPELLRQGGEAEIGDL